MYSVPSAAQCLSKVSTEVNLILRPGGWPFSNFLISFCLWDSLDPELCVKKSFNLVECGAIMTKTVKIKERNMNTLRDPSLL